jgi:hypothetical protein
VDLVDVEKFFGFLLDIGTPEEVGTERMSIGEFPHPRIPVSRELVTPEAARIRVIAKVVFVGGYWLPDERYIHIVGFSQRLDDRLVCNVTSNHPIENLLVIRRGPWAACFDSA